MKINGIKSNKRVNRKFEIELSFQNFDDLTQLKIKWKFDIIKLDELKGNLSINRVRVKTREKFDNSDLIRNR